jgi:VWFA-related protein
LRQRQEHRTFDSKNLDSENLDAKLKAGQSNMKVSRRLCLFLMVVPGSLFARQSFGYFAAPVPSATGNPSQAARQDSGGANTQITLDVVVTDKSGKPQAGLQQQNFTLLDNKIPQKIQSFQAVDEPATKAIPPVEVVLVIDTVNTGAQTVSDERLRLTKYLRQNDGKLAHPTSIVVFSDTGLKNLGEPTLDGNALSTALEGNDVIGLRTMHRAAGAEGASERFSTAVRSLYSLATFEARKPGRKVVIWLSPGWPQLAGSGTQMFSKGKDQLFSVLVQISTALQQARVTLYSIDPEGAGGSGRGSRFSYEAYLKGVASSNDVKPPNLSLQVFVTRSGGRVLTTGNDIASQIEDCISDTKTFYVLSFEGPSTERPDDYHALELKVDKPGLTPRTSAGYYAQPDQRPQTPARKK